MTGWTARARSFSWLATATILLLAVAYIAALVVDAVEIVAPTLPYGDQCIPRHGLAFIAPSAQSFDFCQWRSAYETSSSRTVALWINETQRGQFQVSATVTVSLKDPIVAKIRRGDARQDPAAFVGSVVGSVVASDQPLAWTVPVLRQSQSPGKVLITESATLFPSSLAGSGRSTSSVTVQAGLDSPGTVRLTTRAHVVAGVRSDLLTITGQDAHWVTAATAVHSLGGMLTAQLMSGAVQPQSFSLDPAAPSWLARTASGAWQILRGFVLDIFPAAAWIIVFLASRVGLFGAVGRRDAWQRVERVIGLVLIAHLVVSAAVQISNLEAEVFPSSLTPSSLGRAMYRAGLWSPSGYAAVSGGVVLLIALVICAAGWWARPQQTVLRDRDRGMGLIAAVAGITFAVAGFAGLVWASRQGLGEPPFSQSGPSHWVALSTEIPVAALLALACASLAAAWLSGALALSKATPMTDPLTGHIGEVNAVALGRLGRRRAVVVSGSSDHTVRIWDAATGAAVGEPLAGHTAAVNAVALGRLGRRRAVVVSGSSDHTVRIWDASTGAAVGEPLAGHTAAVNAVALGWVGRRAVVVSGSSDHTVRIWDAATGAAVGEPLAGHTAAVNAVALGWVGRRAVVVSGSSDHTVRIWDASTGAPVGEPLAGHTAAVNAVALGWVGRRAVVVSGSSDHTVRIWDASTGAPVGEPLAGHTAAVRTLMIGRLDRRAVVVSGSSDHTVRNLGRVHRRPGREAAGRPRRSGERIGRPSA